MGENNSKNTTPRKSINVFVLLFGVLTTAALATYLLPAGQYQRHLVNGRNIVVPNSYASVESSPVGIFSIFSSIHEGLVQAAPIIFYLLIIGGMFNLLNSTGTFDALLTYTTRKMQKRSLSFIALTMLIFALGGSLMGMAEEGLIYIPLIIPIAIALGFDVVTGTAIVLLGMGVGFTTAVMNPFTIGIAQGIAGLPLFSGIEARLVLFVIMYVLTVGYVYRYAQKVKNDPSKAFMGDGKFSAKASTASNTAFETKHKAILLAFVSALGIIVYGALKLDWYLGEMSAMFVILSIIVAIIAKISADDTVKLFLEGSASLVSAALIIGLARAIVVVLTNGHIIDTILQFAATLLQTLPPSLCAAGMFVVQAFIHFLVPSGSGQAMLTMPIMLPLGDLVGVTHQTACLIFSVADGIGNTILPTSGYFMAALAVSGIPWQVWVKRMIPIIALQYIIGIIAVIILNAMNYGPF